MSEPSPVLGYQPTSNFKVERRRRFRRLLKIIGKCVGALFGLVVLLIGGDVLYQILRHKTTTTEVRGWIGALPPTATPADVEKLFDAKRMRWIRIGPNMGQPTNFDPSDHNGLAGNLDDVEERWLEEKVISVIVRFDKDDHIKAIETNERWLGP